jgi:hypothetical protein
LLIFLIQWGGARYHPGPANMLQPLLLLLVGVAAGAILLSVLGLIVPRARRSLRRWRYHRRSERAAANAERRARAIMSELCPFGWQAQITLFETATGRPVRAGGERVGVDGPEDGLPGGGMGRGPRDAVALDWAELSASPLARPAVMRRVWAPTIAAALEAMVADRQTDETLEQIEQLAAAEGALWPDLESDSA